MRERSPKKEAGPLWKNTRAALGALLATIAVGEATKAGTQRIDITDVYEQTLAEAQEEFLADPDGCGSLEDLEGDSVCITFNQYLQEKNIPTPEDMQSLQRLIAEFRHPVTFYSGTTLMQKFFTFLGRYSDPAGMYGHWFPLEVFGHEVFLENQENGRERVFTQESFETTIAELAHAYQAERGEDPLRDLNSAFHVFRSEGYEGAYDDTTTAEYEAHQVIEPELVQRLRMLDEHRRSYTARTLREYMNLPTNLDDPQDGVTYQEYVELLQKLERELATDNSVFGTEEVLRLLEVLPGFTAHLEPGRDRSLRLELRPNREHYDAMVEFLGPYVRPEGSITEILPLPNEVPSRASARAFNRYDQERRGIMARRDYLGQMLVFACVDLQYNEPFTRERYDEMMRTLAENHYRLTREPYYQADMETQHRIMLLEFVNNLWKIDPTVPIGDVITAPKNESRRQDANIDPSDAHYEALRRIYENGALIPGY
ncbi:hypothetical protein K2Y00_03995 [Patescibacteria group bacterium]|nr:hypothetical protein [Patescibacteria group bacterium]